MIKLLDSGYDKEEGVSYVTIETEIGNFDGYAFLHPEDEMIESSFLGCEIAEYRATIEYFKKKLRTLNIEIKTLENLRKDFKNTYKEDYHDCEILERRMEQKLIQKKEYEMIIYSLKKSIDLKVDNRIEVLKKFDKKKENKEQE